MRKLNKNGISLIVLVITVIIMIILAASVVITLNNTGIIRKANISVDETELKEVEHLVALAWAEAFMDGHRTPEALRAAMDEKLAGVDLTNYEYTATDKGVEVVQVVKRAEVKKPRPKLNEYGFYYDVTYVAPFMMLGVGPIKLVFHEDGSSEMYSGMSGINFGLCTIIRSAEAGEAIYEKGKITLGDDVVTVVTDDGMELEQAGMPLVCTFDYPEQVQINKVYAGVDALNELPIVVVITDDTHMSVTYYPDSSATESITMEKEIYFEGDKHMIKYPGVSYKDEWHVSGSSGGWYMNGNLEEAEIYITDDATQMVMRTTDDNPGAVLTLVTSTVQN